MKGCLTPETGLKAFPVTVGAGVVNLDFKLDSVFFMPELEVRFGVVSSFEFVVDVVVFVGVAAAGSVSGCFRPPSVLTSIFLQPIHLQFFVQPILAS